MNFKVDGFESGSVTTNWTVYSGSPAIETGTVHAGGYSCKMTYGSTTQSLRTEYGLNRNSVWDRMYVRFHVTTNPGSTLDQAIHKWSVSGGAAISSIHLVVTTGGALSLRLFNDAAAAQVGSDYSISGDTWYRLEAHLLRSATVGELEMKVDGTSRAAGTGLNTGNTDVDFTQIEIVGAATSGSVDVFWDDIVFSDSGYPGAMPMGGYPVLKMMRRRRSA